MTNEETIDSLDRVCWTCFKLTGFPISFNSCFSLVTLSGEIWPLEPIFKGRYTTEYPLACISATNGAYLFDLYSCALTTFISKGTDNSSMRIFFKFFQKTQMSGMRLVWVHSSGIVEKPSFVHRSTFRSVYIIVSLREAMPSWIISARYKSMLSWRQV